MPEQLRLPLASKPAMGRDDFFVSEANQLAVAALEDWRAWPLLKFVLVGPAGSGKTHLSQVWATETGAKIIPATELGAVDLPALSAGALVLEDIHHLAGMPDAQTEFFHLHNLLQTSRQPLLMTTRTAPGQLDIALKDAASRLEGTTTVALEPPDDLLVQVVLMKLFSDRQINPPTSLIDFVVPRLPRSFAAAQRFVTEIDARALRENRPLGQRLAADVLADDLDNTGRTPA